MSQAQAAAALERAHQHLAGKRSAEALAAMLEAWALVRSAPLADELERLSSMIAAERPPLRGRLLTEIDEDWHERARDGDAAELGVLLPAIAKIDSQRARQRLRALRTRSPDPRIATQLHALLTSPPYTAGSARRFWTTLFELLCASADPRVPERQAREGGERLETSFGQRLDRMRERMVASMTATLAQLPTVLDPAGQRELAAITALLDKREQGRAKTGDELLAAVLEQPGELGGRQVYADYLLARGDPRGEFIALQLAERDGGLDRAGRKRVRELLSEHGSRWLGKLGWALTRADTVFEAGFLARAQVKRTLRDGAKLVGDPTWATVEQLTHAPVDVLVHPIMRSLTTIGCMSAAALALLERDVTLAKVTRLEVHVDPLWTSDLVTHAAGFDPHFRGVLERAQPLPQLRELAVHLGFELAIHQLEWLWIGALSRRLDRIELITTHRLSVEDCLRSLRRRHARIPELRLRIAKSPAVVLRPPWTSATV